MKQALIAAVLSALLLNLAFAPNYQGYLLFFAFIPLLRMHRAPWRIRLLAGWLAGFLTQAFGYYWIFYTIRDFGGQSPAISALGACLFWLYQGADLAVWLVLTPILFSKSPRWLQICGFAAIWLLLQGAVFPYVFPWNYGAGFSSVPMVNQAASLWGAHGLAVWAVGAQAAWILLRPEPASNRFAAVIPAGQILVILFAILGLGALFGVWRQPETETWRVGIVQPNIIPWAKAESMNGEAMFNAHYQPSLDFLDDRLDLLIWPETAIPFNLRPDSYFRRQIQQLAKRLGAAVITGAVGMDEDHYYYNEIWMFTPDGQEPQIYQKEKLVVFSETLPWIFAWARHFDPAIGGFDPGRANRPFVFRSRRLVPLVCFEALFPSYTNRRPGEVILNLTNDAWFGKTKASWQHLQQIQPRAVEMGAPLIRATNSGVSCWVDRAGRVQQPTGVYEAANLIYEVPVALAAARPWVHVTTWVLYILAILTGLAGLAFQQPWRRRSSTGQKARRA